MRASDKMKSDTKWVFVKKGTCSRTLFYILDNEYDSPLEEEEMAADPLAGGIMQHGFQCGLLFGTVMGIGAETYRRTQNLEEAIPLAKKISQKIEAEFIEMATSPDCSDITEVDFTSGKQMAKYMLTGKFYSCFKLADKWAPHALKTLEKSLEEENNLEKTRVKSCASECIKKMGGSEREQTIIAGLAGGIGLSGNACGALSAAIWYRTLQKVREGVKPGIKNPEGEKVLEAFMEHTDYEFLCSEICGKKFDSAEDHTAYLENGGCEKLIDVISRA